MNFNVGKIPYINTFLGVSAPNPRPADVRQVGCTPAVPADTFHSSNPERYASEFMISKLVRDNSNIENILRTNGLQCVVNTKDLNYIMNEHGNATRTIAQGIYENLPYSLSSTVDINSLKEAAYLHDIGKVLIPDDILNKKDTLNLGETKVMQLHPVLSRELLRNTNINPRTLYLIENHHQDILRSGYPKAGKDFKADTDLQILALADKYSALTEARAYKAPLSRESALTILNTEVKMGKFNPQIYNALVKYTASLPESNPLLANSNITM